MFLYIFMWLTIFVALVLALRHHHNSNTENTMLGWTDDQLRAEGLERNARGTGWY